MDLFYAYLCMTNNVESCKKINGRIQTFRFSVFTLQWGVRSSVLKTPKNGQKIENLKHKLLKLLKRYDLDITIVIGFQSPLTP